MKYLNQNGNSNTAGPPPGSLHALAGAVVMVHGDDPGLGDPPKLAPTQVVIVPIYKPTKASVLQTAEGIEGAARESESPRHAR